MRASAAATTAREPDHAMPIIVRSRPAARFTGRAEESARTTRSSSMWLKPLAVVA